MPAPPLTPRAINTLHSLLEESPRSTKKERKAAKKSKKVSEMPKVVSTADIDFVRKVLHPYTIDAEDEDIERKLLEDPDIKLNRFFHKGTSNRREIRNAFVVKDRRGSKTVDIKVEAEEMNGLLQLLDVSPITAGASAEEKAIHVKLVEKIEQNLVHVHQETEQMMMRKAGFWRWASKKAYNRLVQNGSIWGQKDGNGALGKASEAASSSLSSTMAGAEDDETDETETDTDITTPSSAEGGLEQKTGALTMAAETRTAPVPSTPKDDGWTTVGVKASYASKAKKPVGQLKLVGNGGLTKLVSSPTTAKKGSKVARLYYETDVDM